MSAKTRQVPGGRWCALVLTLALSGPVRAGEILVAGAVSLREPLTEIARGYEREHAGTRVQLTFGASNFLAAQLRAGAPIDIFVSADARIVDALVAEGLVAPTAIRMLARNRLVVLARPGLASVPTTVGELDAPGIRRIAIPDGAVPVGRYAREWLERSGLLARLTPRLIPTEHARSTLAAVDAGNADVAVVYATDARLARHAKLAFRVPAAEQPDILYAVARARRARAEANAFPAWLDGPVAQQALANAGFEAP